jgi:eukaryotic-like serine/threonine-protein kinase
MALVDVGSLIAGRYRLEQRLDTGGRAQVWRAVDQELDRPVAIKILLTPEGGAESFIDAFHAEAELEARMHHPGIVEVFDWGHDGAINYVVMELLDGWTVRSILQNGVMSVDHVISLGRQASAALAYAHGEGIAHGSITPDHIIFGPDGRATLIDFGLQCRGTCEYPAMPDSDTYELGALMYTALVGASPKGPRPANLPEDEVWPEAVHHLNPNVPQDLSHLIMKAIAPDPDDRFRTAAELQAALDKLVKPKRRAWLWVLIAVVALAVVGVGTWYFSSQMKVIVPDVVGLTQAQAQARLSSAGLSLVVAGQVASTTAATGTVVSENPKAGSRTRSGAQVGVVICTGVPERTVPSVTGVSFEAASSTIASAGLVVGKVTRENSTTFPAGTVISQSPSAGERASSGSAVNVIVSAGIEQVTVPVLTGVSEATALDRLAKVGLVADVGRVYSSLPSGDVVSQGPAAGSAIAAGGTVTLSVSKGPAPVRVPDVTGAQTAAATTSLQNLGLVPVSIETSGTSAQVGTVISQSPDAGTKVDPGSQVRIFVGK